MANALLDLEHPTSSLDVAQENAGQAVVPLNEDFNPPVSSTPERDQRRNTSSAEKRCKTLQKETGTMKKQVLHLREQLAELRKQNDNSERVRRG